ncbi:MAG: acetate--CoA ligase family protein, partial [Candidatus Bipolaricaulia bacterium]
LDLGDLFDLGLYAWITEECLRMAAVDAVLLVHTYAANTEARQTRELVARVKELSTRYGKPVALTVLTEREELARLEQELDWPFFLGIEDALGALAAARDYHRRHEQLQAPKATISANPQADGRISELLQKRAGGALPLDESLTVLELLGIPVAPWARAGTLDEALSAAERLGYPLAAKVISPQALHKTELGGIALNISDEDQLVREYWALLTRFKERAPGAEIAGILLQKMASGGEELILGGRRERAFGPVVLLGLGGIYAELLSKTALRVAPLTGEEAEEMIKELGLDRLLAGFRGRPPLDKEALLEAILKVSQLLLAQPRIAELDINPLLLREEGILAIDSRILIT